MDLSIPSGPEELTAAWLRAALAEGGSPWKDEISAVRVERIGIGYGLDGTVARVTWVGPGGEASTLVAKWCRSEAGAHEARFYREIGPALGIDLPHLLGAIVEADRALLLLAEISPSRQGDAIVGATPAEAERIMEVVGAFHARFWGAVDDPHVAWLPRWGRDPAGVAARTLARLPGFFERWGPALSPGVRAAAERLPEALVAAYEALAHAPATLLHGDFHLDNVLFRPDGAPVVIDWTHAALGPAVIDVVRFLVEGLTVGSRRVLERALIDRYARALRRRGIAYEATDLWASMDAALTVFFAAAIRWKEPGAEPSVPRLVPIIENLVGNVTAAVQDRLSSGA